MTMVLTKLRSLSESTTRLLGEDASAEHIVTRAKRLLALTTALAEADTVQDVAEVVFGIGLGVVEAARGFIAEAKGSQLRIIMTAGYDGPLKDRVMAVSATDPIPLTRSMSSAEPVYLSSVEEYRRCYPWAYHQFGAVSETQAHAALPLVHRGAVIGGLGLSFAEPTAFGAADKTFTLLLAQAAAGALARAIQFDAERASRREAELLARTRAEVLGVVAHDLRNPLSIVKGAAQLALEVDLPCEKRTSLIRASLRAVNQMSRLIGDLLDATRIEGGSLTLDRKVMDIATVVVQADEMFRPLAEQRNIVWETRGPTDHAAADIDALRLLQALGNLVGNALKFTPPGGHVALRADATEHEVYFEVVDAGSGIAPEHLSHLFDRFWQAKADRRGVGLGLGIAKGIADAHGGRIEVASTVGAGSTFTIAIPRVRTEQ
jgi:signal transduction histidine kinase